MVGHYEAQGMPYHPHYERMHVRHDEGEQHLKLLLASQFTRGRLLVSIYSPKLMPGQEWPHWLFQIAHKNAVPCGVHRFPCHVDPLAAAFPAARAKRKTP
jgi:hypothetical protein